MSDPTDFDDEHTADLRETSTRKLEFGTFAIGLVLFIMGLVIGFPLAIIGTTFITENAGILVAIVLTIAMFVGITGALILIFRKQILTFLFNLTHSQLDELSRPLSETARNILNRKPAEAVNSAEELTRIVMARWTWIATRRWLIGSLAGLIAALAALAGTALLFRQNDLIFSQLQQIDQQNALLEDQLVRLDQQNALIQTQIEQGEAQRSAGILPGLLDIGAKLAAEIGELRNNNPERHAFRLSELSSGVKARIIAASQAARPYRYLNTSQIHPADIDSMTKLALARRPDILKPGSAADEVSATRNGSQLLAHATSPERGLILSLLYNYGILETEQMSFLNADFSFAEVRISKLHDMSFQNANLQFAAFERLDIAGADFGGAYLQNARFPHATISETDFSALPGGSNRLKPPYNQIFLDGVVPTNMAGTSFENAALTAVDFSGINGLAMNFDGAVLANVKFSKAAVAGSTFRNAVLLKPDFSGAFLQSVALDEAIVFDEAFLDRLAEQAYAETFVTGRFQLKPLSLQELASRTQDHETAWLPEDILDGRPAFLVTRVPENPAPGPVVESGSASD